MNCRGHLRSTVLLVVLTATVLTGCNRDTPGESRIEAVESNLGDIRSGRLDLKLTAEAGGGPVGFELEGDFAVAKAQGRLPVTAMRYSRFLGDKTEDTLFHSTESDAFVEIDGEVWRLEGRQLAGLRAGKGRSAVGLEGLHFTDWFDDPAPSAGPSVDGARAQRVKGEVDAVAALNDVFGLARTFAGSDAVPAPLEGEDAERVRTAVKDARGAVVFGRDDQLLREIDLTIRLAVDEQERLRPVLGDFAAVEITLHLTVRNLNEPVKVTPPPNARPISERTP